MKRRTFPAGGTVLVLAGGGAVVGLRQTGSMTDYNASIAHTRAVLSLQPEMQDLVRYATLAPNGHNTQPWRFRLRQNAIQISPDFSRRTPVVDPDDHHLFVSLGCAAENLVLASSACGYPGDVCFSPDDGGSVVFNYRSGPAVGSTMFDAIPLRQSTRCIYDGRPVSREELSALATAAAVPGIDLIFITERVGIERVRDLVVAGNDVQMGNPAFIQELRSWLRFSPRQAARTGDGLFSATSGNPVLPAWLGPTLFDWTFRAKTENETYTRQIQSSSGIAIFASQHGDPENWVRVGRACQRFALQATALGLKLAFINQPDEVASLRPELARLAGIPGRRPDIVMRFGYGPGMPFSARRSVAAVLA